MGRAGSKITSRVSGASTSPARVVACSIRATTPVVTWDADRQATYQYCFHNNVLDSAYAATPPAGETTDKGYVNQRGVLQQRAALVDELYAGSPGPEVRHL